MKKQENAGRKTSREENFGEIGVDGNENCA
jgi:hypothetical protein